MNVGPVERTGPDVALNEEKLLDDLPTTALGSGLGSTDGTLLMVGCENGSMAYYEPRMIRSYPPSSRLLSSRV